MDGHTQSATPRLGRLAAITGRVVGYGGSEGCQPLTDFEESVSRTISARERSEAVFVRRENPARHFFRVLHCGPA
jgi:hypothetical protein